MEKEYENILDEMAEYEMLVALYPEMVKKIVMGKRKYSGEPENKGVKLENDSECGIAIDEGWKLWQVKK